MTNPNLVVVPTVKVEKYLWEAHHSPPECDSCCVNPAEYKVSTGKVGIRFCRGCLEELKENLCQMVK